MKTTLRVRLGLNKWLTKCLSGGPVSVANAIAFGMTVALLAANPLSLPWWDPAAAWAAVILLVTAALAVFTAPRLPWLSALLVVAALTPPALEWTQPTQDGPFHFASGALLCIAVILQVASIRATALSRVASLVSAVGTAVLLAFVVLWRVTDFQNAAFLRDNPDGYSYTTYAEDDIDQSGPATVEYYTLPSGEQEWGFEGVLPPAPYLLLFGLCWALGYVVHAAQRQFDTGPGWHSVRPSALNMLSVAVAAIVALDVMTSHALGSGDAAGILLIMAVGIGAFATLRWPRIGLCIVGTTLLLPLMIEQPLTFAREPKHTGLLVLLALAVAAAVLPRGRSWWWWTGSAAGAFALWMGCGVTNFDLATVFGLAPLLDEARGIVSYPGDWDSWSIFSFVAAILGGVLLAAVAVALGFSAQLWMRYRASRAQLVEAKRDLEVSEERRALADERRSIAGDVHDVLAHSLTVIVAQGEGALVSGDGERDAAVRNMVEVARASLRDVRALIERLDGEDTDLPSPGLDDLPALVQTFRSAGLPVESREFGERAPLGDANQLAVFRIAQESLTNVLKHGGRGARAVLILDWRGSDPGLALTLGSTLGEPGDPAPGNGMGIEGMRTRAAVAGGWLSAGPTTRADLGDQAGVGDGDGWLVTAQIPAARELAEVLR